MTYVLVLVIGFASSSGGPAMTSVPGFADMAACASAGDAFVETAKKGEWRPRYYCVHAPAVR